MRNTLCLKGAGTRGFLLVFLLYLCSCSLVEKSTVLHVSAIGSDHNSGTKRSPVNSLEKAREMVRSLREKSPGKAVTVYIQGGIYYLEEPLVLSSGDSGNEKAPVVYKAAGGEIPVFTGSRDLKNWQLLSESEKGAILPEGVRTKIYFTDVKAAGINDLGDPTEIGLRPELFCNGELQTLARWPNNGFVKAGLAKGDTKTPPNYAHTRGTKEGIFEYTGKRMEQWRSEPDVRLGGYWYWDWSDEFQKVERVDTGSRTIVLKQPYHNYGYRDSLRYFGLNLFCEIDEPGEWYLDRTQGLLYWLPPAGIDPNQAKITLSVFSAPFMVEMKECSNVTLQGLTFRESRGSAVIIQNGTNCKVSDCRIECFGKDGIHIEGGTGHGISGCMLRNFGCGGIHMKGGERKNLVPASHFVENSAVENFSLFKRTYQPAVFAEGCGLRISNNRFKNSSSSALRLEGNDITVEFNEISHVVNESDDQGALDIWNNPSYRGILIRCNRWTDIKGGTRHGAAGVRLDDMISGVTVYGNIFERCGSLNFGGVQIHGGKDNLVENNLFYNCPAAVSFSSWGQERWIRQLDSPEIMNKIYEEVDIRSGLFQNRYPELKNIRLDADVNVIKNNLLVDCQSLFLRENNKQISESNNSLLSGGKGVEAFCKPEVLQQFGMQSIPLEKIGPKDNPWMEP